MLVLMLISVTRGSRSWEIVTPSSELPAILRWLGSQSREISPPESHLWGKSLGETKRSTVYELSAVSWKGKHNRKRLYPEWQWQQAVKEKLPFSELYGEWKFASWIWRSCGNQTSRLNEITTHSLFLNIFCARVQKGSMRRKSNLR